MPEPHIPILLDRSALREGLGISRRRPGWFPAKAIMLATSPYKFRIPPDMWNHDAIIVRDPKDGVLKIGDALMGSGCVLTPIEDWEKDCVENGTKILVWKVAGITREQEKAAAQWWLDNVAGHEYDKVAIWRLGLKWLAGDWLSGKVGLESDFYCTEGVRDSFAKGGGSGADVWGPKDNATPETTWKRWKDLWILTVHEAVSEAGRPYCLDMALRT